MYYEPHYVCFFLSSSLLFFNQKNRLYVSFAIDSIFPKANQWEIEFFCLTLFIWTNWFKVVTHEIKHLSHSQSSHIEDILAFSKWWNLSNIPKVTSMKRQTVSNTFWFSQNSEKWHIYVPIYRVNSQFCVSIEANAHARRPKIPTHTIH